MIRSGRNHLIEREKARRSNQEQFESSVRVIADHEQIQFEANI